MMLVPLPFFVAFLLILLLVQGLRRDEDGFRAHPLFHLLLAAYAVQSVLVGLRWGYDLRQALLLMAPLAMVIAPLTWLSFRSLMCENGGHPDLKHIWPHVLPVLVVIGLMILWPDPVGTAIVLVYAGYGAALLWLSRSGPDGLVASRLDGVVRSHRAMQVTGSALLASAATDLLVSIDQLWGAGAHSGTVIAVANVLALLGLGLAASVAGSSMAEAEPGPETDPSEAPCGPSEEDRAIAASIEALMRDQELYRDVELNLCKIARKLKVPPRVVSLAINRLHGVSVSQYVNAFRVKLACRLLAETPEPITRIMFDAGFLTKSNFNREFQRVTGMSPTGWRQAQRNSLPQAID